jgi:putative methyltransferase (TIGR04325 family)
MLLRHAVENVLSEGAIGRVLRAPRVCESAYWRFFQSPRGGDNFQFGRYATYAQALAAIPPQGASGWNNEQSAHHYIDSTTQPSSYAVLFWLSKLLAPDMQIVDLGGSTGQMYHTFCSRSELPPNVRWHVVDVEAAVELGRRRAAAGALAGLDFESNIEAVPPADILHSSGALQFMGDPLPGLFDRLQRLPRWIIVNKIVLSAEPTFWTLHNIGTGICTYQIFNETDFLRYFADRGYVIRDRWRVAEISMLIPFHPEGYVPYASGFCFELPTATLFPN